MTIGTIPAVAAVVAVWAICFSMALGEPPIKEPPHPGLVSGGAAAFAHTGGAESHATSYATTTIKVVL